jgi:hypothetical protein
MYSFVLAPNHTRLSILLCSYIPIPFSPYIVSKGVGWDNFGVLLEHYGIVSGYLGSKTEA